MTGTKLRVLISGAGIAGPCLAFWLSRTRHDVSITIVERSPVPRVTGQALDVRGPAIDCIKMMGLEEKIRSLDTTETGTEILNSSGKPLAKFKKGEGFTAQYEILRADLAGIFLEATENLPNVTYRYGESIKSLQQTQKEVHVTFSSGQSETFDMVAGADGASSPTRPMILEPKAIENSYQFLGQYIAFFSIPKRDDDKVWKIFNVPKGRGLMLRPHRNDKTMGAYISITMPKRGIQDPVVEAALKAGVEAQKKIVRKYFENEGWETQRILEGMDASDDFYMAKAAHVRMPKHTNGRGVLLGDAASATFGIGTSMAIQAGYLLAGEISKIQSSAEIPEALKRYDEVFHGLFEKVDDSIEWFPQMMFPQTAMGLRLMGSLMWFVSKTKLHKLLPDEEKVDWKAPKYDWVDV